MAGVTSTARRQKASEGHLISQKASKLSDQVKVTPEPIEMTVSCRVPWLIKHDYKEVWENCPETQDDPGTGLGI